MEQPDTEDDEVYTDDDDNEVFSNDEETFNPALAEKDEKYAKDWAARAENDARVAYVIRRLTKEYKAQEKKRKRQEEQEKRRAEEEKKRQDEEVQKRQRRAAKKKPSSHEAALLEWELERMKDDQRRRDAVFLNFNKEDDEQEDEISETEMERRAEEEKQRAKEEKQRVDEEERQRGLDPEGLERTFAEIEKDNNAKMEAKREEQAYLITVQTDMGKWGKVVNSISENLEWERGLLDKAVKAANGDMQFAELQNKAEQDLESAKLLVTEMKRALVDTATQLASDTSTQSATQALHTRAESLHSLIASARDAVATFAKSGTAFYDEVFPGNLDHMEANMRICARCKCKY